MGKRNRDKKKMNYEEVPHFVNERGHHIFCRYWDTKTSGNPRAIAFVIHGVGEHCGYYDDIAAKLTEKNILVCGHDHVGHGQSEGPRVHINNFSEFVDDMVQHVKTVKSSHPECPVFAIGHSMGGTIALKTALDHPNVFNGVVLIGPAIVSNPDTATPIKVFMAKAISKVMPQCPVAPIDSKWISRDPAIRKKYDTDPLVHHGGLKAKWAVCMLETLTDLQSKLAQVEFPLLVLHGDEDKLCEVSGSKMLHQIAKSTDKTLKIYPGGYHQIHNEPDGVGEGAISDIASWISERI